MITHRQPSGWFFDVWAKTRMENFSAARFTFQPSMCHPYLKHLYHFCSINLILIWSQYHDYQPSWFLRVADSVAGRDSSPGCSVFGSGTSTPSNPLWDVYHHRQISSYLSHLFLEPSNPLSDIYHRHMSLSNPLWDRHQRQLSLIFSFHLVKN